MLIGLELAAPFRLPPKGEAINTQPSLVEMFNSVWSCTDDDVEDVLLNRIMKNRPFSTGEARPAEAIRTGEWGKMLVFKNFKIAIWKEDHL